MSSQSRHLPGLGHIHPTNEQIATVYRAAKRRGRRIGITGITRLLEKRQDAQDAHNYHHACQARAQRALTAHFTSPPTAPDPVNILKHRLSLGGPRKTRRWHHLLPPTF